MSEAADERRLTAQAIDGDRQAFAALYARYERRVYNLCYRILASPDDAADATQEAFVNVLRRLPKLRGRELNFGAYLFTAARHASYDAIARRGGVQLAAAVADTAVPVGGELGRRTRPEDDPARNVLLEAQQKALREANARMPVRHREVLALRALGELSYDEIAAVMGMNRNSVAQLLSRARIRLRAELRSATGVSMASAGKDCERALPLLAMADDRELRDEQQARWLEAHLHACARCEVAREVMAEAGESYRAWLPLAAVPWLLDDAWAEAAELDRAASERALRLRRRWARATGVVAALVVGTGVVSAFTNAGEKRIAAQPRPPIQAIEPTPSPPAVARPRRGKTPLPSRPAPTATVEPTTTPRSTATPAATSTPRPTTTPRATSTPTPTTTPRATSTPTATSTPRPTTTPRATSTPTPTTTPRATSTPTPTATSEPTTVPERPVTPGPAPACSHRAGRTNPCPVIPEPQ